MYEKCIRESQFIRFPLLALMIVNWRDCINVYMYAGYVYWDCHGQISPTAITKGHRIGMDNNAVKIARGYLQADRAQ